MNRTVNSGDISFNHGDKPTGIEVPPLSRPMIVRWTLKPTFWAWESRQEFMRQFHRDL